MHIFKKLSFLFRKPAFSFSDLFFFLASLIYVYSDVYDFSPLNFGFCLFFFSQFLQVCGWASYLKFFKFPEANWNHYKLSSQSYSCCMPWILNCCISVLICLQAYLNFLFDFNPFVGCLPRGVDLACTMSSLPVQQHIVYPPHVSEFCRGFFCS